MTRVDFYVLQKQALADRWFFACRLVEKAVKQGNKVLIATEDESSTTELDKLLWSYSPESFVPHTILGQAGDQDSPVVISHERDDENHHDVMVNLCLGIPPHFSRFKRVTEIVVQDQNVLAATRKNYGYYNERGYPVTTHKL